MQQQPPLTYFPDLPVYSGFDHPGRIEADIFELEVHGQVPRELRGAFYRVAPEPQFPPLLGYDTVINGDGMVGSFRFQDGHVDYRSRYVRTEKFLLERAARRSLFGAYRNPFTDDSTVRGRNRGTANTNVLMHGGRLLALKEDSQPIDLNPNTLETVGARTDEGRITSRTVTAHPKVDPVTGELVFFGYAAKGETTRDIARITRWSFDLAASANTFDEQTLWSHYCELPRIDDRFAMAKHRYGFVIANDPSWDFTGGGIFGRAFNTVARYDFDSRAVSSFALDGKTTAQEPVLVPRDPGSKEADGYLLVLVNRFETMLNDLLVFDTQKIEAGPVATIKLPIRLRNGVHGNWVPEHLLRAR